MTLLHLAIYANQFDVLKYLLIECFEETKQLLNVPNSQGYTPLILATILGDISMLRFLIERGANLEICDYRGRTAVHHAVYGKQLTALKILDATGASLKATDFESNLPLHLLGEEDIVFKNIVSNLTKERGYLKHAYPVNFALNQVENIVFKGGGPKGIAYLGAIKELERRDILGHIKRIAGTSAGAITAALLAVGCNAEEAENLLIETSGTYFLDHPFTEERLDKFVHDNLNIKLLKETYDMVSECVTNASPVPALKHFGSTLVNVLWKCTGICAGKRFLYWIEKIIERKTGIPHCTFGELAELVALGKTNPQGRKFKHLHIYATKLSGQSTELVRFSSEDPAYKNLIISEAVRASMSIPVVFQPHILVFKQKTMDGAYEYSTSSSSSRDYEALVESLRVGEHIAEDSYIDGGLIYNFPIKAFDRRGYVQPGVSEEEKEYYQFNRKTLGFSLYSAEEERTKVRRVQAVETVGDLLVGVYTVFRHAESLIDKMDHDPRDKKRIIALDNQAISLTKFSTTPLVGKGAKAMDEAEKKTREFFEKQESEVAYLTLTSLKQKTEQRIVTLIQNPELKISEAEAKKMLTLGPAALRYLSCCKVGIAADTALAAIGSSLIVTLPFFIPAMHYRHQEPKSLKSRKLELLSCDNSRLVLFKHIGEGEFGKAYAELANNQEFYKALMKTYVFVSALKKCLINCDNKFYRWDSQYDDPWRFRCYMHFFRQTQIIPSVIPREFVYDLPEL